MMNVDSESSEKQKLDKVALIQEASDLAIELVNERVPRLDPHSKSADQTGISRTHLKPFVNHLARTQDLTAFRCLLDAAPGIDRVAGQNQENPLAHHSTVAKILLATMKEHPQRDARSWLWLLSWTARLLVAEEAERKTMRKSKGKNPGSGRGQGLQHQRKKPGKFGNPLASLQQLLDQKKT